MQRIKIVSIHCVLPDEIDKDEMYLKHQGEKIWPKGSLYHRLDSNDAVKVDLEMAVSEGWVEIELWDFDYLTKNDFLGVFKFKVDATQGIYTNTMELKEKGSTASYIMRWEIL